MANRRPVFGFGSFAPQTCCGIASPMYLVRCRELQCAVPKRPRMNTEQKRQTTLSVTYSKLPEWQGRLKKMQECKTLDALISLHGPPHHKVQHPGFEIWHYPLGVEWGMQYNIHVSLVSDQLSHVFLYFEPTSVRDTPPRRRWWQFWKKKHESTTTRAAS